MDESEFQRLLSEQRTRARNARKNAGADAWLSESVDLDGIPATEFTGYATLKDTARILAILREGERVESAEMNDDVVVVLDRTPFYAESGGQVGDTGFLTDGAGRFAVLDTTKHHSGVFLHHCHVVVEGLSVGSEVECVVDGIRRYNIMRNHTAAHLLQAALRKVLGTHVEQAGQLVDGQRVRFDFTHFSALTKEETARVEEIVNDEILSAVQVTSTEMPIEEAKKLGAMALFGEKYGDIVRVVQAGEFSTEFCGGTHVNNTARLGLFKIISESSVASGVRRIEGVTGRGVLQHMAEDAKTIQDASSALKLNNPAELPEACEHLLSEQKELRRELEKANARLANWQVDGLFDSAEMVKGVKIITGSFSSTTADALRTMSDRVRENAPNSVAVFAAINDGKAVLSATAGKEAQQKGCHAGNIVRAAAKVAGGNGGGKPDFAMAGAKDLTKIDEALAAVNTIVSEMVKE